MPKHRKKPAGGLGIVLAAAALLLLLCGSYLWFLGGTLPPQNAAIGGSWTMTRDDGQQVTDGSFRGRYMLVYFGYTACPDICPTTLTAIGAASGKLGAGAAKVQPVFITVDPARDTPEALRRYLRNFAAGMIGLTGTQAQVRSVIAAYRIEGFLDTASPMNDTINHNAVLLLIGPDGQLIAPLAVTNDADHIAEYLRAHLS